MLDPRLGQIGGVDTKVCAVTERPVSNGMIRYSLGNGYYFRVYPQRQRDVDDAFIATMKALIPKAAPKASTKTTSEDES